MIVCITHVKVGHCQAFLNKNAPTHKELGAFLCSKPIEFILGYILFLILFHVSIPLDMMKR
jgi:hypothetical protein